MFRRIEEKDWEEYLAMCRAFYSGNGVSHPIPDSFFRAAFNEMLRSDVYLEGYILEWENRAAGYALMVKSFMQESGGMMAFLDELYIRPECRGLGLGTEFLKYAQSRVDSGELKRVRLEVTAENARAERLYRSLGYRDIDYRQLYIGV